MTDVAVPVKTNLPKKASKLKKPAMHPNYCDMVTGAISTLKERRGSSRQAILTYICKNYKMENTKMVNSHLKLALRAGVKSNAFKHAKGTGASGSFKLGDEQSNMPILKKVPSKPKKVIKVNPSKAKSVKSSPKKLKIKKSSKKVSKKIMKTAKPKRIIKKIKIPKKMTKK